MNRIISEDLLNKIANYLASQPYIQVAPLIQELSRLPAQMPDQISDPMLAPMEASDKINSEEKKPGQAKKN